MHNEESRRRAYQKVRQRRIDWLTENGPCQQCGSTESLEVDHIDPSTKLGHNIWSWSDKRRISELAKCQVLCRVCHQIKSARESSIRMGGRKHGTDKEFIKHKCRCEPCKLAHKLAKQKYYLKKKSLAR